MGINDAHKIYDTNDLAPGKKIIFAATGVTDGALLRGVRFFGAGKRTHSVVMTTDNKKYPLCRYGSRRRRTGCGY